MSVRILAGFDDICDSDQMNCEAFRKLHLRHNKGLMICPSALGGRNQTAAKPLFLYHARRTGGMTFYYAIYHALYQSFSYMKLEEKDKPKMARVESPDFSSAFFQNFFMLVGSHAPFGLHHKFNNSFQLTSLFRDTFPRLRSTYLSGCMRKQVQPTRLGFEHFFELPENCNGTTKQLCGLMPDNTEITTEHAKLAIEVLNEKFDKFSMINHIKELISIYLTEMGLPNIVMEKTNQTLPEYQLDLDDMREHVEKINAVDRCLIEKVRCLPQPSHSDLNEIEIAPITVVVREKGSAKASVGTGLGMPTAQFLEIIDNHPTILGDLNSFWDPELGLVAKV